MSSLIATCEFFVGDENEAVANGYKFCCHVSPLYYFALGKVRSFREEQLTFSDYCQQQGNLRLVGLAPAVGKFAKWLLNRVDEVYGDDRVVEEWFEQWLAGEMEKRYFGAQTHVPMQFQRNVSDQREREKPQHRGNSFENDPFDPFFDIDL
jgi:hypothetical protein